MCPVRRDHVRFKKKKLIYAGEHFTENGDWVWTSVAAKEKYLLGSEAAGRGQNFAASFVNKVLDKIKGIPIIVTDGYKPYLRAVFKRYAVREKIPYSGRGRPPIGKLIPHPDLKYGQVIKTRKGVKLEKVEYVSVYGKVPKQLLNTSAIERHNGTLRTHSSRMRRRSLTFAKSQETFNASLDLNRAYYNFCKDHTSLCIPRKENNGVYKHVSPAMKIGITDHVWNIRELLGFSYRNNKSH